MNMFRRVQQSMAGLAAAGLCALSPAAFAQAPFPGGPIRILVGFPAGGTIDVVTRLLAEQLHDEFGVAVTVENPTGAGGQIAAQALKRAAPDGRTLMVAPDHTAVVVPLTVANPGFAMATDFVPVGLVANYAGALAVSQASGVKDLAGLLTYVKANPGVNGVGSVGVAAAGSKPQFELGAVAKQFQVPLNAVPYRGSVPLVQDLAGGHLMAGITALGDFLEQHKAGKLKVVAMVGDKRSSVLPDVPTATELGYPMKINFWIGLFAPAGTPQTAVDRLNQALNKTLATPKVRERMEQLVFEPAPSTPAELSTRIAAEMKYWEPVVKNAGWVKQ